MPLPKRGIHFFLSPASTKKNIEKDIKKSYACGKGEKC